MFPGDQDVTSSKHSLSFDSRKCGCVLKWHSRFFLWLKEKLMNTFQVWCHHGSHFSNLLTPRAVLVHCVTLSKSFAFSISDSEGVVSRGDGGPLLSLTRYRSWKDVGVYICDWLWEDGHNVEWKKSSLSAEQMNSWPLISMCVGWEIGVTVSFLLVRASELLDPPENFLSSPEVAVRFFCKNKSTDLHPRFSSE